MIETPLLVIALIGTAATFGGMVYFTTGVAPLVFIKLPTDTAGKFIRELFPVYYLWMAGVSGVAALAALLVSTLDGLLLLLVAVGFGVARQVLMPMANTARDQQKSVPTPTGRARAARRFDMFHRASVWLNAAQMLVVALVLLRLGL